MGGAGPGVVPAAGRRQVAAGDLAGDRPVSRRDQLAARCGDGRHDPPAAAGRAGADGESGEPAPVLRANLAEEACRAAVTGPRGSRGVKCRRARRARSTTGYWAAGSTRWPTRRVWAF